MKLYFISDSDIRYGGEIDRGTNYYGGPGCSECRQKYASIRIMYFLSDSDIPRREGLIPVKNMDWLLRCIL